MIGGIGIDTVEIARFIDWHNYPEAQLLRLFSPDEIAYCLQNPLKQAERFAARFAAKEAFFKAFCAMNSQNNLPLSVIAGAIEVKKAPNGSISLFVNWAFLLNTKSHKNTIQSHISLTHTEKTASAIVILEKIENK
jgi:holo-[acyl-carrier protein] synthase